VPKISPFLWFDSEAEEAANFYTSLFDDSEILNVSRYGGEGPGDEGKVMTITFRVAGLEITGLNGGPAHKFSEGISLFVNCDTQEEVDELWEKLTAGGEEGPCGWLKDRWGLSWQIIPSALGRLLQDEDPEKANRVMKAMLEMKKIDTAVLEKAYEGR
jgi:predicted 3-demethylubiquinone-9 3-methyltransferase (glyoxalase superfamily)